MSPSVSCYYEQDAVRILCVFTPLLCIEKLTAFTMHFTLIPTVKFFLAQKVSLAARACNCVREFYSTKLEIASTVLIFCVLDQSA